MNRLPSPGRTGWPLRRGLGLFSTSMVFLAGPLCQFLWTGPGVLATTFVACSWGRSCWAGCRPDRAGGGRFWSAWACYSLFCCSRGSIGRALMASRFFAGVGSARSRRGDNLSRRLLPARRSAASTRASRTRCRSSACRCWPPGWSTGRTLGLAVRDRRGRRGDRVPAATGCRSRRWVGRGPARGGEEDRRPVRGRGRRRPAGARWRTDAEHHRLRSGRCCGRPTASGRS